MKNLLHRSDHMDKGVQKMGARWVGDNNCNFVCRAMDGKFDLR